MAARLALAAILCSGFARAQIAGENVNMVSGTAWPGGDPFLQRQNEPSIAVSSANAQHLLAGANDYRTVDIAFPDVGAKKTTGDAWLGVFKSLDGGQSWKSVLLPGYPQACDDPANPDGMATPWNADGVPNPLCGHPAAADPVVRAGTDGMLYFAGITFKRDKSESRVFVARLIDLDNKEDGDATRITGEATRGSDPIKYIDTQVIATAAPGTFIDKPWIAVDVARTGAAACNIPALGGAPARAFPAGTIYVAWAQFKIDPSNGDETSSDILFSSSRDCGASWSAPIKLNNATSKLNQGVSIAIDPVPGRVYVAWRRYSKTSLGAPTNQSDAILAVRSNGRSKTFTSPRVIGNVYPFDQGSSGSTFRTDSWPTMAISSDGKSSWANVAWQQKLNGSSRIVMSTANVHPPPPGEQDPDDPEYVEKDTRLSWSVPAVADEAAAAPGPLPPGYTPRGHQFMPSLTFGQGRLVLTYYDTRFDHTQRLYKPWAPLRETAPLFEEQVALVGDLLTQDGNGPPSYSSGNLPYVFNEWITDANLAQVRHTVEVRVATALPGPGPRFATSQRVSRFDYGVRRDGNDLRYGAGEGELWLQQLQFNPPNLPIFAGGTRAFLGDYIDVQGPAFSPGKGGSGWDFNFAPTGAPVFHAVWTSNQDVRVPYVPKLDAEGNEIGYEVDWTKYTPVAVGESRPSLFDPTKTCEACVAATAGSRDQNIYTSRITEGLRVAAPQNAKPLSMAMTRAFVITAENDTAAAMTVRLTASSMATGVAFSFVNEELGATAVRWLDVTIPPRSGIARSLFVKLTDAGASPSATLAVNVEEVSCASACRAASVTLNPPIALASLVTPDAASTDPNSREAYDPTMGPGVVTSPAILGPAILGPAILGPAILGPAILGDSVASPAILGPAILGPAILGPAILGPAILGDSIASPAILGPAILGPAILGPAILGDGIASPAILGDGMISTSLADVTYTIRNEGNTTASYHLQLVASQEERETLPPLQLIVTRTYETPVASGCELATKATNQLVSTAVVDPRTSTAFVSPSDAVDPKVEQGAPDNISFAVPPGGEVAITARVNLLADPAKPMTLAELAAMATRVRPAIVASSVTPSHSGTYAAPSSPTGGIGTSFQPTRTSLAYDSATATATADVTALAGTASAAGVVTFIRGGSSVAAVAKLAGGAAAVALDPPLAPGEALIAYYGGSVELAPSTSALVGIPTMTFTSSENPSTHGQEVTWTAIVSPPAGGSDVTGVLTIREGSNVLGTCFYPGPAGVYSCGVRWNGLAAGSHTLTADYGGDANYLPATASLTQVVTPIATTTSLATDRSPWAPQVTFTASLTAFGRSPTGTVTFRDDAAQPLAEVPLTCTPDLSALPVRFDCRASFMTVEPFTQGDRSVTATYSGDAGFAPSTSSAIAWAMPPYVVLEQAAMDVGANTVAVGGTSNQKIAQVVVGSAGRIGGIRVPLACSPGAELRIDIKGVTDYRPNALDIVPPMVVTNASELLPELHPSLEQFRTIVFDTPATVDANDPAVVWGSFAVVLSATGSCGMWQGPVGNVYGGTSYEAFFDALPNVPGVWVPTGERHDIPFQIFMQLVQ